MSAPATERVGRYQLLEPIGVGPNGTVSRAKVFGVAGFERQFAIKRFHAELTSTAALAQALSAAARAYGGLEHPRIARMSEFGVAQGTTFTAVEFVSGLDALRLIAEARMAGNMLAPGGALALVSQAARAIGYAHGRGLTHLGLAPTNVMITAEGDIKITDFGILSAALPPRPVEVMRLSNRIPYLAPEQLASEATSAATDVFALGVLAYELVTGHRTFRGETPQQIAQSVMAGPPIEPPLPRPIVRVLQRCLARSPFERFPDARALADALDAALRVAPVPGTRKDVGAQVKQTMERIAALHEGEMSGVLALNIGTGPIRRIAEIPSPPPADRPPPVAVGRSDDFATNEFARIDPNAARAPGLSRAPGEPAVTVPDLPRPGGISTVTGLPPMPIPVPQGVTPPPIPSPPPAIGTSTLLGISPGARPSAPPIPSPRPGTGSGAPPSIPPVPGDGASAPWPDADLADLAPPGADPSRQRITSDLSVPVDPSPGERAPVRSIEVSDELELEIERPEQERLPTVRGGPEAPPVTPRFDPAPGAEATGSPQLPDFPDERSPGLDDHAPPYAADPPAPPPLAGPAYPADPPAPPPGAPAPPHAYPPGPIAQGGYPPAAGLAMPRRDAAGPGPQHGAGARPRGRIPLVLGGLAAAAALAVAGWLAYGAITAGDATGGGVVDPVAGGSAGSGSGSAGSAGAGASPGDAAIAVAAPDDAAAPAAPDAAPKAPSELSIVSTPPGARVFLDGADAGVTPLKLPGTPDRHTIALLLAGHDLYVAEVDGQGQFSLPLKEVTPSGGPAGIKVIRCKDKERYYVYVDGKPTGQTCPTERIETTLGPHTVEVYDVITETRRKFEIVVKETRLSHRVRVER